MKNRYDNILRDYNQEILTLVPANQTLRFISAMELKKVYRTGSRVLEIGCGEGDSARYILELSKARPDLLDISQEMINLCKKNLHAFSKRTKYICEDAFTYLEHSKPYDIIFSEWVIHNFKWPEKINLLKSIYTNLKPGGTFILMDKVYTNTGRDRLFQQQIKRYSFLAPKAAKAIVAHEKQDYSSNYRMDEKFLISALKKIGFRNLQIVNRVERDVVIVAKKSNVKMAL